MLDFLVTWKEQCLFVKEIKYERNELVNKKLLQQTG